MLPARMRSWLLALVRRDRVERELAAELDFHIEARASDLIRRGLSPADARRRARLEFGSVERYKEEIRSARGLRVADELKADLLSGWRALRRSPGFTAVAVVSLALGVGANTLVFSLLDSTLLRPLDLPAPDQLVAVWTVPAGDPTRLGTSSIPRYFAVRDLARSFEGVAAFNGIACGVKTLGLDRDGVAAERIFGQTVSPTMFQTLGVEPLMGRTFTDAEDQVDRVAPVVLLSHRSWQRRFGGDPAIVGQTVMLDRAATTIIGVLPEGLDLFGKEREFFAPLCLTRAQVESRVGGNTIVGRLLPGVSIEQAQAELDALAMRLASTDPARHEGMGFRVESLKRAGARLFNGSGQPSGDYGPSLLILQGAVAFVLLIACANVAGLLLARGAGRHAEVSLRMTLGAGRARITRQVMTESLPLAGLGAAFGVLLAWLGLRLFLALAPAGFPRPEDVALDVRVLSFTAIVSFATSLVFALVPAIQASGVTLGDASHQSHRSATWSAERQRLRSVLVAGQVALALVLLVGAGLMIHSFVRVLENELGANPGNLLTFDFRFPAREAFKGAGMYRGSGLFEVSQVPAQTVERVFERLQAVPGVEAVAAVSAPPFGGQVFAIPFLVEGRPAPAAAPGSRPAEQQTAEYFAVTPGYFRTMDIPVIAGRDFDGHDRADAPAVVVINQTLSRQFFAGEDPIGKYIRFDFVPHERPRQIVGVVGDTLLGPFQTTRIPVVYVPHVQQGPTFVGPFVYLRTGMTFVLRTAGEPLSMAPAVKRAVAEIDRATPVADVRTVEQTLDGHVQQLRLSMWLLGLFGAVAALLAGTGIYGVIAYSVAQRTREFGVRMALGASAGSVLAMVLRRGTRIVGAGVAAGVVAALLLTRAIQASLFEVTRTDPATYASVAVVLVLMGTVACLIPARRATAINPIVALRHE